MTSTSESAFYKEPTHDEIALSAFLSWQKDGCPPSTGFDYWIEAERRLRAQRQKQAEAAATRAAKTWPPSARSVKAKPTPAAPKPAIVTARDRGTTVKVARPAKSRATRATAIKGMR